MKWTVQLNEQLRQSSEHDLTSVKAFAEQHGISYRSVIPQVKKLGLTYITKTGTRKAAVKSDESCGIMPGVRGTYGGNRIPESHLNKFTIR